MARGLLSTPGLADPDPQGAQRQPRGGGVGEGSVAQGWLPCSNQPGLGPWSPRTPKLTGIKWSHSFGGGGRLPLKNLPWKPQLKGVRLSGHRGLGCLLGPRRDWGTA